MRGPSAGALQVIRAGRVPYLEALAWQGELEARRQSGSIPDTLLCLEHPPVITLGHRGDASHIVASDAVLAAKGIEVHRTTRGGDVTYHGPGQLVAYPIVDVRALGLTVAELIGRLEEAMIRTAADHGVAAGRLEGRPGVFVGGDKIGAVGIHLSRGVTTHGLAFNVDPDLSHYDLIIPCGLRSNGVTSLRRALAARGADQGGDLGATAQGRLLTHLAASLGLEPVETTPSQAGLRP